MNYIALRGEITGMIRQSASGEEFMISFVLQTQIGETKHNSMVKIRDSLAKHLLAQGLDTGTILMIFGQVKGEPNNYYVETKYGAIDTYGE